MFPVLAILPASLIIDRSKMLFWIIFGSLAVVFWLIRSSQWRNPRPLIQGVEQLFFCSVLAFCLSFFGMPVLDFKTGSLIDASDPAYFKLRFASLLLVSVSTPIYFLLIYLENRKEPR